MRRLTPYMKRELRKIKRAGATGLTMREVDLRMVWALVNRGLVQVAATVDGPAFFVHRAARPGDG